MSGILVYSHHSSSFYKNNLREEMGMSIRLPLPWTELQKQTPHRKSYEEGAVPVRTHTLRLGVPLSSLRLSTRKMGSVIPEVNTPQPSFGAPNGPST